MLRTSPTRMRAAAAAAAVAGAALVITATASPSTAHRPDPGRHLGWTATPVEHLVVIFDENVSFDHYFGTYPNAANTDGTPFTAAPGTPSANTLQAAGLLTTNPNAYLPQRLASTPEQSVTCDQSHDYGNEQLAVDGGLMDKFVEYTNRDSCTGRFAEPGLVMDYYDGNTVTALWNYAQHYAMSDNSWDPVFGPSTPGALNLVSGQTHGVISVDPVTGQQTATPDPYTVKSPDANGVGTVTGDPDPAFDDCSDANHTTTHPLAVMQGRNVGDLLNARGVTWGFFEGGFRPTTPWDGNAGDYARCESTTANAIGSSSVDYIPHHQPFQYYRSTANPHHLPPTSVPAIGRTDQANHQYDLTDFDAALAGGTLPAVSFLKPSAAQDAHPGYSGPLDEQKFLVKEINAIQQSRWWKDTAIVVAYDDSDGWYDHVAPEVTNGSNDPANGDTTICTSVTTILGGYADRCGPSQRLPLLVISPFAKMNFVDHTKTDQTSILRFIEQNWRTRSIGDASFDRSAGSLLNLFDFHRRNDQVLLADDGSVATVTPAPHRGPWHGGHRP